MVYNISRLPRLGPADVHGTPGRPWETEVWSSASTQQAEAVVSAVDLLYRNILMYDIYY